MVSALRPQAELAMEELVNVVVDMRCFAGNRAVELIDIADIVTRQMHSLTWPDGGWEVYLGMYSIFSLS